MITNVTDVTNSNLLGDDFNQEEQSNSIGSWLQQTFGGITIYPPQPYMVNGKMLPAANQNMLEGYLADVKSGRTISSGTYAGHASSLPAVWLELVAWGAWTPQLPPTPRNISLADTVKGLGIATAANAAYKAKAITVNTSNKSVVSAKEIDIINAMLKSGEAKIAFPSAMSIAKISKKNGAIIQNINEALIAGTIEIV